MGTVELDLIQPMEGKTIWSDFLSERGPGIHHLRFNVPYADYRCKTATGRIRSVDGNVRASDPDAAAIDAGHDRLVHNAGVDTEPIPELEYDHTLGW